MPEEKSSRNGIRAHGRLRLKDNWNAETISEIVKKICLKYKNVEYIAISKNEITWTFYEDVEELVKFKNRKEKRSPSWRE